MLDDFRRLPIQYIPFEPETSAIPSLAQNYGLSGYDAAYLELALDRKLELLTLDRKLQNAYRRAKPAAH